MLLFFVQSKIYRMEDNSANMELILRNVIEKLYSSGSDFVNTIGVILQTRSTGHIL